MKIISFDNAKATWLFPLEEFAPASGANSPSVLDAIAERYKFTHKPTITTREDLEKKGLVFGVGGFSKDGDFTVINDFAIYTDGLAAVSRTTEFADAFLDDVSGWVIDQYKFRKIDNNRRLYSSNVVVEFEHSPAELITGHNRLIELLNARTKTIMNKSASFRFSRLDFEMDKRELVDGQTFAPKFVLERRAGVDFSKERYFSAATMQTAEHLVVLNEIEKLAATLSTGGQRPS
jgi:hypothetical protein